MLYGPTLFKCCSECSGYIEQETILSGNTLGAMYWTDGKIEAPMLPESMRLVKCPHCKTLLQINELEAMDDFQESTSNSLYLNAKPFLKLTFDDYIAFIKSNKLASELEIYARIMAWRKGNDMRRALEIKPPFFRKEIENLLGLEKCLDLQNPEHCLISSEIKRELGFFSESEETLKLINDENLTFVVNKIESLVKKKVQFVAQIEYGN